MNPGQLWRYREYMRRARVCHIAMMQGLGARCPDVQRCIYNQRRAGYLYQQARAIRESYS